MNSNSHENIVEPFPISCIGGQYLLFDIDTVTYLRRTHHICGVLLGVLPQIPQQNIFSGLPVQLLPEEARLLVEKGIAYIVQDSTWHREKFNSLRGDDRSRYVASLRAEGAMVKRAAEAEARMRSEVALARQAAKKTTGGFSGSIARAPSPDASPTGNKEVVSCIRSVSPASISSSSRPALDAPYGITRTITYSTLDPPSVPSKVLIPTTRKTYPLYQHLHERNYFLTPGLRFGCDYTVYPGDPLRFHSHFLAVGYEWEEEIPMLDVVGGGRLGTGVKKGFLIGGSDNSVGKGEVRTFCLEWGGM